MQEESLPNLAQSDVHVTLQEGFVHVGAFLEGHLRANTAFLLEVPEDLGRHVARYVASASFFAVLQPLSLLGILFGTHSWLLLV